MLKINNFLSLFFLVLSFTAQGQYYGWSIYDHFQISSKGCDLPAYETYLTAKEIPEEPGFKEKTMAPLPPSPRPPLPPGLTMEQATEAQKLQLIIRDLPAIFSGLFKDTSLQLPERRIELYGGNYAFLEKDKWGIKDTDNKVLLSAEFDFIIADTVGKGFAGYRGTSCKYYDANGKELLNRSFYGIKPIDTSTFLVHGEQGYGIIRDGKVLIQPDCQAIVFPSEKNYFKVKDKNQVELFYLPDFKTSLVYPVFKYRDADLTLFGDKFLVIKDKVLIDIQKGKRMFTCDAGYTFKVLDAERELILIQKDDKKYTFPIDRNGIILKDTAFSMFHTFDENGLAIASPATKRKIPRMNGLRNVVGLINKDLEWVLEPAYQQIAWKGDHYLLKMPWRHGMANIEGRVIVPCEYSRYAKFRDSLYFFGNAVDRENVISTLISAKTGRIIKDSIPFYHYEDFEFCGKPYFLATLGNGTKQLLDENLNPITSAANSVYKWRDYLVLKGYGANRARDTNYVYNCLFEKITLKIGNREISHFNKVQTISDELDYFVLNDETSWLTDQQGIAEPFDYQIEQSYPLGIYDLTVISTLYNDSKIIDLEGKTILPLLFNNLHYHPETGLISYSLSKPRTTGFINTDGEFIFDGRYERANYLGLGLFAVKYEGQWAVVNRSNQIILPYQPEEYQMADGLILQGKAASRSYFDVSGKWVR